MLTLYVDNTSRENKNNTFFGYLAWLVEMSVFRTILLGFLPVGYVANGCHRLLSSFAYVVET